MPRRRRLLPSHDHRSHRADCAQASQVDGRRRAPSRPRQGDDQIRAGRLRRMPVPAPGHAAHFDGGDRRRHRAPLPRQVGRAARAAERRSSAAACHLRPLRHQPQCPRRRRHGAVGHCGQGRGPLAVRPAGRRATGTRVGDGEPRPLQRCRQGKRAHRAGARGQGRRGQGPRVRPRCHRNGAQAHRTEDAVRRRLQQRPHARRH